MTFKVGDRVKIVFDSGYSGTVGTVTDACAGDPDFLSVQDDKGITYLTRGAKCELAVESEPDPVSPPKFKVGDRVKYVGGAEFLRDLAVGDTGEVAGVHDDVVPYEVQFDRGTFLWMQEFQMVLSEVSDDTHKYHFDATKPRWSLIPSQALSWVLKAFEHGSKKYEARSYRKVPNGAERYAESLFRHVEAVKLGLQEEGVPGLWTIDEDSGLPHLALAGADVLIVIDLMLREQKDGE